MGLVLVGGGKGGAVHTPLILYSSIVQSSSVSPFLPSFFFLTFEPLLLFHSAGAGSVLGSMPKEDVVESLHLVSRNLLAGSLKRPVQVDP